MKLVLLITVAVITASCAKVYPDVRHNGGHATIDRVKPVVKLSGVNNTIMNGVITIPIEATDASSGVKHCGLYLDNLLVGTTSTPPYSIEMSMDTYSEGFHTLTAVAQDYAGNTGKSDPVRIYIGNTKCASYGIQTFKKIINQDGDSILNNQQFQLTVFGDTPGITGVHLTVRNSEGTALIDSTFAVEILEISSDLSSTINLSLPSALNPGQTVTIKAESPDAACTSSVPATGTMVYQE